MRSVMRDAHASRVQFTPGSASHAQRPAQGETPTKSNRRRDSEAPLDTGGEGKQERAKKGDGSYLPAKERRERTAKKQRKLRKRRDEERAEENTTAQYCACARNIYIYI